MCVVQLVWCFQHCSGVAQMVRATVVSNTHWNCGGATQRVRATTLILNMATKHDKV